ncbi:hypothetical protein [uncultured Metabacillus sp.]|uniref:hypothetical protein n=1 Tax=uncultured Metabacillus sp. TaxID=2860135 RepID=UPI0026190915|nr:hypothetical protein [uncultured Metabacillus sp.]
MNKKLDAIREVVYGANLNLERDDIDWLIEQAEKFQTQKQEIKRLREALKEVVEMATSGSSTYSWELYKSILLEFDDFEYDAYEHEYVDKREY